MKMRILPFDLWCDGKKIIELCIKIVTNELSASWWYIHKLRNVKVKDNTWFKLWFFWL